MIRPTERRLALIFTAVVTAFTLLILSVNYLILNRALMEGMRRHVRAEIEKDFIPHYLEGSISAVASPMEDEHYQVLDRQGAVAALSRDARHFGLQPNMELLAKSFAGRTEYEVGEYQDDRYLIAYFPLDDQYSGRIAIAMDLLGKYMDDFMEGQLVAFPGIMLAVYLVSRALLRFAMKPIADAFTFQETFSSNVSHELRSPLTSLQGNFEVALRRPRQADEYREALAVGLKETGRIITVLNNLTLLASSKFRPLELMKRPVDIKPVIDAAAAALRQDAEAADISVAFEVEGSELVCACDESLVRRVIENLVSNAVKYTARHGHVRMKAARGHGKVVFGITNTCVGLTADDLPHVFAPFFRGRNAAASGAQGHGIGLYVSRYIIASHGGEMKAEMGEDGSFSVWFSIPA
ncbi:MAG: hypothetical protein HZA20_08800 [Nitrospirae bacterium]|nr:hypothetical protein [Nitrospirota bacterium]